MDKQIGIREHIDENVNLYTVCGILNALTIYSTTIETPSEIIKSWLTFCFLTLSIILWGTIKFSINSEKSTFALKIYLLLVDFVSLTMIGFWAIQFKENRNFFLFWVGIMFYAHLFGNIIYSRLLTIKSLNKFFDTKKKSITLVTIFTICIILSAVTTKYIDKFIEYLVNH